MAIKVGHPVGDEIVGDGRTTLVHGRASIRIRKTSFLEVSIKLRLSIKG